jgi:hypothetical protein
MCDIFSRQQLLDSLLHEVNRAQNSFQAIQLSSWRELAPGKALPALSEMAAIAEVEMQFAIMPYRPPWYLRLYQRLHGEPAGHGDTKYLLANRDNPASQLLTLRIVQGKDGLTAEQSVTQPG